MVAWVVGWRKGGYGRGVWRFIGAPVPTHLAAAWITGSRPGEDE